MSFELKGKLIEIFDEQQVSESFRKREFVIEKAEQVGEQQYIEQIKFQAVQDKCDMLNGLNKGDEVNVSFNIRGRAWENKEGETKYFTNLDAWRIEAVAGAQAPKAAAPQADETEDDLPF